MLPPAQNVNQPTFSALMPPFVTKINVQTEIMSVIPRTGFALHVLEYQLRIAKIVRTPAHVLFVIPITSLVLVKTTVNKPPVLLVTT